VSAMRVLLVNKFAQVSGGADQHCLSLVAGLRERGHDVRLLSTASEENVETDGIFVPCAVTHASRDGMGAVRQAHVALTAIWNRAAAAAAKRLISEFLPEVVHVHKLYPQLSVAPVFAAARARVPIVQTLHDFELVAANPVDSGCGALDASESRLAYRALNSATFLIRRGLHRKRISRAIVPSRYVAALYASHGISTTVLPNFTEVAKPGPSDPRQRKGIAFVGRLHRTKGVEDVIALARRLPAMAVTVAGAGPLDALVRREASNLPNLVHLGPADRAGVARILQRARVAVMPSHAAEAGPLVALEAMAVGTPIVAYDRGGLAEYVRDTGGGRVVPPLVDDLVAASERLCDSDDDWRRLSADARRGIARTHSRTAYVQRLEQVYEEAVCES
jgi:glycosyltransferase involved in cell wall biosynthesis